MSGEIAEVLPLTMRLIVQGIEQTLHRGVQLYVSRAGRVVVDGAIGESHAGVPLTADTLNPWLSAGKPLTAVAVLRLVEAGRPTLDDPVCEVIPEFRQGGKQAVRVQQLLTHTAGLEDVISGWPNDSWDEIIARVCRTPLIELWDPGRRGAYDPGRTWFVLGELIRRLTGRPVEEVVRDDIMRPLGMRDSWMSISPDAHRAYGERIGRMHQARGSVLKETRGHTTFICAATSPGSSCRGPIRELGYFYEMLLKGGERKGVRLLSPQMVAMLRTRQREGVYDETFGHIVDFGLGVIIDSNRYGAETVPYGFGRYCSPSTFGHGGARTSVAFADPAHDLVVAAFANGAQPEPVHNDRFRNLTSAIYEDLRLVR